MISAIATKNAHGGLLRSSKLSLALSALILASGLTLPAGTVHAADADEAQVKAYIKKQKAAGKKPKGGSPNWKKGYTCNDLKKKSFEEYQECRYYYEVNGRFYPG